MAEQTRETGGAAGTDTMSGADTLLWAISSDPVMRPTVVAVLVCHGPVDWETLRARVGALTEMVPRLRARVVTRWAGRPRFERDEQFDLDLHLRRQRLHEPSSLRDVLDIAQVMATGGFDTALPLWDAVLVEGFDGDSSALVLKVHHAVVDGVGGLAVLAHLFDGFAERSSASGAEAEPAPEAPRARDLAGAVQAVTAARDAMTHPLRSAGQLGALGASVARLLAPAGRPESTLMRGRGARRHVEVVDLPLDSLRAAAAAWGGTVNDVFVAAVVRGLARYHDQHGVMCRGFRILMPINVRPSGEVTGGNHFVPVRFVIPVHAEIAECVAEVTRLTRAWKSAPGLEVSDLVANALSALPAEVARGVWGSMLRGIDVCVTNVPGPPFAVTLTGAEVGRIYALAPPSAAALNVSLVTVGDRACVALTVDSAAIADSAKLAACVEDGFGEVCAAGAPAAG